MNPIDINKKYKTISGKDVVIYKIYEDNYICYVHGAYFDSNLEGWISLSWSKYGKNPDSQFNLVELLESQYRDVTSDDIGKTIEVLTDSCKWEERTLLYITPDLFSNKDNKYLVGDYCSKIMSWASYARIKIQPEFKIGDSVRFAGCCDFIIKEMHGEDRCIIMNTHSYSSFSVSTKDLTKIN